MGAITAAILAGAGAIAQASSQVMAGQAAARAGRYAQLQSKREVANLELEQQAATTRKREQAKSYMSGIVARLATQGTLTDTGTPLEILGKNAGNIELSFLDAARATAAESSRMLAAGEMAAYRGEQKRSNAYLSSFGGLAALGESKRSNSFAAGTLVEGLNDVIKTKFWK